MWYETHDSNSVLAVQSSSYYGFEMLVETSPSPLYSGGVEKIQAVWRREVWIEGWVRRVLIGTLIPLLFVCCDCFVAKGAQKG